MRSGPRPRIDLDQPGPGESAWATITQRLPAADLPDARRLVVVSPHPDDETLGAGGLIATADERGLDVLVVAVTDGEAAGPRADLAVIRRQELAAALPLLCAGGRYDVRRLGIPDGGVAGHENDVQHQLRRVFRRSDLVIAPLVDDGHPDHESTARAAIRAAGAAGAAVRTVPIWAWHCHDPQGSPIGTGQRLDLTRTATRRKRQASGCYRSQTTLPDPVVPPFMLDRLLREFEVLIDPLSVA